MPTTPPIIHSTRLAGQTVIVTGGTRGIGWEIALALMAAGANVVATGRSRADLDRAQQRAALAAKPDRFLGIAADVRIKDDCIRVVAATVDRFGDITGLVNNAGVAMRLVSEQFETDPPPFWQIDSEAWREIVDTNVGGVFQMSRCTVPIMLKRGKGRLINVSSSPRMMRLPGWSPYGASKAAIESMTATWAQELSGTGITVNVVRPGGKVDTGLFPNGGCGARASEGFIAPSIMNGLIVWLLSDLSDGFSGRRFNASLWNHDQNEAAAARAAMLPYPEEPHLF